MPSSFIFYGPNDCKLKVTYKLRAFLEEDYGTAPLECERRIVVRRPATNIKLNKQISQVSDISTFFFVRQGISKADITFEKDSYSPNENANILCVVDNSQCTKDITNIYVKLVRVVKGFDSSKDKEFSNRTTVLNRKYPGVAAGKTESKLLVLCLKDIANETSHLKQYKQKKKCSYKTSNKNKKKNEAEDLAMAELMLPSTQSHLISCTYTLKVEFTHSGWTLGSKIPPAVIPINIYAPSIPNHLN